MNLDDESFLSAYLDDELDPADRLAVEWAVESSPPLAARLRALASARQAVAGLSRPAPPRDLAFSVVADLAVRHPSTRLARLARSGRLAAAFAVVATMAASLFLALTLLHLSTHDGASPRDLLASLFHPTPAPSPVRTHPIADPEPIPPSVARVSPEPKPRPEVAIAPPSRSRPARVPAVRLDPAREAEGRRLVEGMIGQPRVIRAVIVTDVIDVSDRVRSLIESDPRKYPEFGRITIAQGIVVDPDRPDEAEVYPVVLDERGCQPFLDRLRREFPALRVEPEVGPGLLTQLPEIGQVAIFRGTGAAELVAPPLDLQPYIANKDATAGDPGPVDLPPILKTRPRHAEAGMVGEFEPTGEGPARDPRRKPDDPVTVIVWVTRPSRH